MSARRLSAPAARSLKAAMLGAWLAVAAGDAAACFVAIEAHSAVAAISAEETEQAITVPLETVLQSLDQLQQMRSQTSAGRVRIELRCTAADAAAVAGTVREQLRSARLGLSLRTGDPRVWPIERPQLLDPPG